jgi:hypothetical protein
MSVKVRQYKKRGKSGWEVDILFKWPDGELYRERVKASASSKSGAKSWGEQRQSELLSRGREAVEKKAVPTLKEFAPRYLDEGARANRQKALFRPLKASPLSVSLLEDWTSWGGAGGLLLPWSVLHRATGQGDRPQQHRGSCPGASAGPTVLLAHGVSIRITPRSCRSVLRRKIPPRSQPR